MIVIVIVIVVALVAVFDTDAVCRHPEGAIAHHCASSQKRVELHLVHRREDARRGEDALEADLAAQLPLEGLEGTSGA